MNLFNRENDLGEIDVVETDLNNDLAVFGTLKPISSKKIFQGTIQADVSPGLGNQFSIREDGKIDQINILRVIKLDEGTLIEFTL